MGKYLARGHGVRTERSEVRAPYRESQIFSHPVRPNLANKYFIMTNMERNLLEALTRKTVRFCSRAVRLFPAPLAQILTARIRDFHQWFCKESARRAVRVI